MTVVALNKAGVIPEAHSDLKSGGLPLRPTVFSVYSTNHQFSKVKVLSYTHHECKSGSGGRGESPPVILNLNIYIYI